MKYLGWFLSGMSLDVVFILHIGLFVLLMCPPCVKEAGFWFSFQNTVKAYVFQDVSCVVLEMWSRSEWWDYPMDFVF